MRISLLRSIVLLLMGLQAASSTADVSLDALVASPDRFKVLLENDDVRVIEYVLLPAQRDQWHTHPPKVSYVISGGTLRISLDDGSSFEVTETTGSATWMNSLGRHFAENVGPTTVRILLVEVKAAAGASEMSAPAVPATGVPRTAQRGH